MRRLGVLAGSIEVVVADPPDERVHLDSFLVRRAVAQRLLGEFQRRTIGRKGHLGANDEFSQLGRCIERLTVDLAEQVLCEQSVASLERQVRGHDEPLVPLLGRCRRQMCGERCELRGVLDRSAGDQRRHDVVEPAGELTIGLGRRAGGVANRLDGVFDAIRKLAMQCPQRRCRRVPQHRRGVQRMGEHHPA